MKNSDKRRERDRQYGNDFTKGAVGYLFGLFLTAILISQVVGLFFPGLLNWIAPRDASDSARHRSGVSVVTDYGTGCEYLRTRFGGIVPRMGEDGVQVCGAPE